MIRFDLDSARLALAALLLAITGGCVTLDKLGSESVGSRPGTLTWLESPRPYAEGIAAADRSRRTRERQDAINYLLRDPRAESAVRLQLVFAAAVQDLEEANEALDQLDSALAQVGSPFARSVLESLVFSTQAHQRNLRAVLDMENQLTVERGVREQVELERDRLALERTRLQRAIDDAENKLRALMSIEQELQDEAG